MYNNYLYHHGIKGQKWGIRRFQNEDGSFKSTGKQRYVNTTAKYREIKTEKRMSLSKMSTGKKVAIGAAAVAAVSGITVAALMGKNKSIRIERGKEMCGKYLSMSNNWQANADRAKAALDEYNRRINSI